MEIIRKISNLDSFIEWCEGYRSLVHRGAYSVDFKRKYIELGWKTIGYGHKFYYKKAIQDERAFSIAKAIGCPDAKLFLLCLYEKGGGIKGHRDDTPYGKHAYCISSTDYTFIHDGNMYQCMAGLVYKFDAKKLHSVPPLEKERWALIWWEANPKYRWKIADE